MTRESCRENQNTHSLFSNFLFEKRAVYEVIWKHRVKTDWPHKTIEHMCFSCRISNSTHTHTLTHAHTHTQYKIRTYCFARVKMFTRTHLSITLCLHCLSCCMYCRKTFYKIRRNESILKPRV